MPHDSPQGDPPTEAELPGPRWIDTGCAEPVPFDYNVSWNCRTEKQGKPDPAFVPVQAFVRDKRCQCCGYPLECLEQQTRPHCPQYCQPYDKT